MYTAVTRRGCATAKEDHVGGRQLHCSLNPNYGNSGKYGKSPGRLSLCKFALNCSVLVQRESIECLMMCQGYY